MYNSPAAAIAPVVLAARLIVDRIAMAIADVVVDAIKDRVRVWSSGESCVVREPPGGIYGSNVVVFRARSFGIDAGEPFVAAGGIVRSGIDAGTTHGCAKGENSLALDFT